MEHLNDSISAGERGSMGMSRRRTPQQQAVTREGKAVYHEYISTCTSVTLV